MEDTKRIAYFVKTLSYEKIPDEAILSAKKCLIDFLGVTIFATETPWGQKIIQFCSENGLGGSATIFPIQKERFNSNYAALANGTCAHGFELDDVHSPSMSHPGAVVIPAALAIGELKNISGRQLLEGIIVGYDVMARVGSTIGKNHIAKGFHPTGTVGVFGAAAACAKILNLNEEQIQDSFGLAGSYASGLMQFSINGSMVKRIHAGKAARQGVELALLAEKGFTGPREILEGKYGFCNVFTDSASEVKWSKLTDNLGTIYEIQNINFKPSAPACNVLHSVIECIKLIHKERSLADYEIEEIVVQGHEKLVLEHNVYAPESILSAQYSLPFTVGLAVQGEIDNPKVYLDETILQNETVLEVAKKVTTEFDEEIQLNYPFQFGAKVIIKFTDGITIKKIVYNPKGSTNNPFSEEELVNKFYTLTDGYLNKQSAKFVVNEIYSIENLKNIKNLFSSVF